METSAATEPGLETPELASPSGVPAAEQPTASLTAPGWMLWACRAVVALLAVLTFLPALQNELLPWDDQGNIVRNPHVQAPLMTGLAGIWKQPYDGLYVPLVYTTFALESAFTGGDEGKLARLIHLDNLLLHSLAALLVFELLRHLLGRSGAAKSAAGAACAGALLFALHPLQAEAVNWATGRKDLLAGALGFFSLLQYARWREQGSKARYALAVLAFLLALLAKPAAAAIPLAALALDWFALRLPLRRSAAALVPWVATAAVFAWSTAAIQRAAGGGVADAVIPIWQRPLVAADSLAFYLEKLIIPVGLSPVYSRSLNAVLADTKLLLLALPLVSVPLALLLWRRNLAAAGTAMAIALLLPASGVVPFHYQTISTVADRYVYGAMLGVALAVAAGIRWTAAASTSGGALRASALSLAVIAPLGVLSWKQGAHWRNSDTLWTHAARLAPTSAVVQNNLGMVRGQQERKEDAQKAFEEAVRLKPDFAAAHNNLANLHSAADRKDQAIEHYRKALKTEPNHTVARTNLAVLLYQTDRQKEAAAEANRVLEADPNNFLALNIAVIQLGMDGKGEEGLKLVREAAGRKPEDQELAALVKQVETIVASERGGEAGAGGGSPAETPSGR